MSENNNDAHVDKLCEKLRKAIISSVKEVCAEHPEISPPMIASALMLVSYSLVSSYARYEFARDIFARSDDE